MSAIRTVLFTGIGGQGVLSAARFLGEAAHRVGLEVCVSQLHGMSQRGGSVQSTVTFGGALHPGEGPVDVLVGLELLESLRVLRRLDSTSTVVVNRLLLPPPASTLTGHPPPAEVEIISAIRARAGTSYLIEANALAREAGQPSAVNTVLLGALSGRPDFPLPSSTLLDAICQGCAPATREANTRAFALGAARLEGG